MQRGRGPSAAVDSGDGQAGRLRAELLLRHRPDFCTAENGSTRGGRRELDNAQFFTRLGQRLIKALDQPTQDGFVYRVDMRLRPFGDSGPLVLSFAALEDYYREQGRDWERYAMVKARIMGDSDDAYANELRAMLRPFVFRRYIDFSVIQSLRNMKGMIAREVRRRGLKGQHQARRGRHPRN